MLLFDRIVKVIITGKTDSIEVTDLRITFDIKKDDSAKQNQLTLQIYNLSQSSRSKIEEKDLEVELFAGYDGVAELIFKGQSIWTVHKKDGPDIITKIQVNDGSTATREKIFTESFKPGISVQQIVEKLADSLGLPVKGIPSDLVGSFVNGFSASDSTKNVLDKLKKSFGFEWSIQDGELQITKTGTTIDDIILAINKDTGMLGFPEKLTGDGDKLEGDQEIVPNGVNIVSLLLPKARPGRRVQLDSSVIAGDFKIIDVAHSGDTRDEKWQTSIKAELL